MRRIPEGLVTLADAARMACFEAGVSGAVTQQHLEQVARRLCQILTVYALPDGAGARALDEEELRAALASGRPPLGELAVSFAGLRAALKLFRPAGA